MTRRSIELEPQPLAEATEEFLPIANVLNSRSDYFNGGRQPRGGWSHLCDLHGSDWLLEIRFETGKRKRMFGPRRETAYCMPVEHPGFGYRLRDVHPVARRSYGDHEL